MDLMSLTLEEIQQGWRYDEARQAYICLDCGSVFTVGEVYPFDGRFFDAAHAAARHVAAQHPGRFEALLAGDSKYNGLTDTQKELLRLFHTGLSDGEIAKKLGISPSTVRHQKFTFREKAKAAKLYLALYEMGFAGAKAEDSIITLHEGATMVDDRYVVTEKERQSILQNQFASLSPLRLKQFSRKEKKKLVVLTRIAAAFSPGVQYTEKQVNEILEPIYHDFVTLRRYLIEYGFMDRARDGSAYWLKG